MLTIVLAVLFQCTCFNLPLETLSNGPSGGGAGTDDDNNGAGGGGAGRIAPGAGGACFVLYLGLTGLSLFSGDLSVSSFVYTCSCLYWACFTFVDLVLSYVNESSFPELPGDAGSLLSLSNDLSNDLVTCFNLGICLKSDITFTAPGGRFAFDCFPDDGWGGMSDCVSPFNTPW